MFKMTYRRMFHTICSLVICLSMLLTSSFPLPLKSAAAVDQTVIDQVAGELAGIYFWLGWDAAGKSDVQAARSALSGKDTAWIKDQLWPAFGTTYLPINAAVSAQFGGDDAAKTAISVLLKDAVTVTLSTSISEAVTGFANISQDQETVKKLLPGISLSQLYSFFNYAQTTGIKNTAPSVNWESTFTSNDYASIRALMSEWLRLALANAADNGYSDVKTALKAIGWDTDSIAKAENVILQAGIDPDYQAEKALLKAYVRYEAHFSGAASAPGQKETISYVQGGSATGSLTVLGKSFSTNLQSASTNPNITATYNNGSLTVSGGNAGDSAEITLFYTSKDSDWIYKANVAVSSGGGGGGGGGPAPVSDVVGMDGGTVTAAGGAASVNIPAGALDKEITVTIVKVDAAAVTQPPLTLKLAGDIYEFGPAGTQFNKPVKITLKYDPAKLGGVSEDGLKVYYLDETANAWVAIGGVVDKVNHTLTVEVNHFSKYAVMFEAESPPVVLTDIAGHWAKAEIEKLVALGIVNGYPDRTFRPDNNITRAEFTKILVKAMGLAEVHTGVTFSDVPAGLWSHGYIGAAFKAGLVRGYEDGTFRPESKITRQEMAAMLVRAMGKENEAQVKAGAQLNFGDVVSIAAWANGYIAVAVEQGLVRGYPDGTVGPLRNTTRAETATMTVRFLDASQK